jgi:hypothetical protein
MGGMALVSGTVFAHQTYNLTGDGLTIGASVNNTDSISNTGGYGPVGVGGRDAGCNGAAAAAGTCAAGEFRLATPNTNVPGTDGPDMEYTGALP